MYEDNGIIKDARVLAERFIPKEVVHRDGQLKTIRDNLKPMLKGLDPRNTFLFGSPGTGKTCMAQYVSDELSSYSSSVLNSYINCWECSSRFKVLYTILQQLGLSLSVHRKGTPTDELLGAIKKKLNEHRCVIVLDEVDQLEDDRILYDLSELPNACLIMISNLPTVLAEADPRVRSRLASAESVEFPLYRVQELFSILKFRTEWGLMPGVIKNTQLERIAGMSRGDARVAINILKTASESAENQDLKAVPDKLIDNALPAANIANIQRNLEQLNPYQQLILEIVRSRKTIDSGNLQREFNAMVPRKRLEPIVERTFRKHMDKLVRYGFVRPSGDGRWRSYSVS